MAPEIKQLERSREELERIQWRVPDALQVTAEALMREYGQELELPAAIDLVQRTRRLIELCCTGAFDNRSLLDELKTSGEKTWFHAEHVQVDPEKAKAVAQQLFKSSLAKAGEKVVIVANSNGRQITEEVIRLCLENNVDFEIDFEDHARQAIMVKHLEDERRGQPLSQLDELAALKLAAFKDVNKVIRITSTPDPVIAKVGDSKKEDTFTNKIGDIVGSYGDGRRHYILTRVPTRNEAEMDGMSFQEYCDLFFEACDQPWDEIFTAQEKLITKLDEATTIHISNEDETDVTLDVTGQTFANSVVLKNLPGSEMFSAPLKEGVNGTIIAKGNFQYRNSGIIRNITLRFKNGRIVEFDAEEGREALAEIIARDDGKGDGSHYLGEIGIGTNPHLRKQSLNPLLVEKVGGSFHVAVGKCYTYNTYGGKPVKLQNGNTSHSKTHWDVTTLLRGKDGKISLSYKDGSQELIQDNGKWLPEGCEVLNEGWGVFPTSNQPQWFQYKFPNGYEG